MMTPNSIVVILLKSPDRGRRLADALAAENVGAEVADSSEDLHRRVSGGRIEVVVVEQALGGFLSGLEIVARLQKDLVHPATVLVGDLSPVEQDLADRQGIRSVVSPRTGLGELASAVMTQLSRQTVSRAEIPLLARRLAASADVVQPLPQLLTRLCGSLRDETSSLASVAEDLSIDPRITAELLKTINSAAFGLGRKVTSVQDAVALLGIRRTVATVLSTGVLRTQAELLNSSPSEIRRWYNARSVLVAGTAASFAGRMEGISQDTAHVLGLFQDLGVLVLAKLESRSYLPILRRAMSISQLRLESLEKESYGITHADISAALLETWDVPTSIANLVLEHHRSERRPELTEAEGKFLRVMRIGEAVANLSDVPGPHRHRILSGLLDEYGSRRLEDCRVCLSLGVARAVESSKLFSIPLPDEASMQSLLQEITVDAPPNGPREGVLPVRIDDSRGPEPLGREPVPRQPLPGQDWPQIPQTRTRVLFIDDEQIIVKMASRLLMPAGFDVIPCHCTSEAAELALHADVILCDVHLRNESGINLVRQLRLAGVEAPVIMISGDRTRTTVVECIEAGIVDYVVKPFTRETLIEKIRKHLDRSPVAVCAAP